MYTLYTCTVVTVHVHTVYMYCSYCTCTYMYCSYCTCTHCICRYNVHIIVSILQQGLHFETVFAAAKVAGYLPDNVTAKHIGFGVVLGENKLLIVIK